MIHDDSWRRRTAAEPSPEATSPCEGPEYVTFRTASGVRTARLERVEADGTHVVRLNRFDTLRVAKDDVGYREDHEVIRAETAGRLAGRMDLRVEARNATAARMRYNPRKGEPQVSEVAEALGVHASQVSLTHLPQGRLVVAIARRGQNAPTRFWGSQGAGILFVCPEDGTMLLGLRSPGVNEPNTWGIPGGAVGEGDPDGNSDGDDTASGAAREVAEEFGGLPVGGVPMGAPVVFTAPNGKFKYTTYIHSVKKAAKDAFKPRLNWENTRAEWFPANALPSPLHFGFTYVLKQRPDLAQLTPAATPAPDGAARAAQAQPPPRNDAYSYESDDWVRQRALELADDDRAAGRATVQYGADKNHYERAKKELEDTRHPARKEGQVQAPASVQVKQVTNALVAGLRANDIKAQDLAREMIARFVYSERRLMLDPSAEFSIPDLVQGAIPALAAKKGELWERVTDYALRFAPGNARIKLDSITPGMAPGETPGATPATAPAAPAQPDPGDMALEFEPDPGQAQGPAQERGLPMVAPLPPRPGDRMASVLNAVRRAAMSMRFEIDDRYQQGPVIVILGKFSKSEAKNVSDAQILTWWRQTVEQDLQRLNGGVWSLQHGLIRVELDREAGRVVGKTTVGERTGLPLKDERERITERA